MKTRPNNQEDDASQPLAAFFANRRAMHRSRRPTSNVALSHQPPNPHAVGGLYRPTTPVKPVITKRKLQMESIGLYPSRPATTVHITGPRAKNNNVGRRMGIALPAFCADHHSLPLVVSSQTGRNRKKFELDAPQGCEQRRQSRACGATDGSVLTTAWEYGHARGSGFQW